MSHTEFDREIPLDEQLQEVSLILMEALFRVRRDGPPPRPPSPPAPPVTPLSGVPRPKRSVPKPYPRKFQSGTREHQLKNLFLKRKRIPKKRLFWQEKLISLENAPADELARAVCHTHQPQLELEFRDAFDYVMGELLSDERRIADLVAEHGITHAARELSLSWRQIYNALVRMRRVFIDAGIGSDRIPLPIPRLTPPSR